MSTADPIPDVPPEPSPTQKVIQKTEGVTFAVSAIIAMLVGAVVVVTVIEGFRRMIPQWSWIYSWILGGITFVSVSGAFASWGGVIWAIVYFSIVGSILAGYTILYGVPPPRLE